MPTSWTEIPSVSSSGTTRVPEDILRGPQNPNSPLLNRGPIRYTGNSEIGFPRFDQHYSDIPRPPIFRNSRSQGLLVTGFGQESDGYGSSDDGNGVYLRLDRAREAGTVQTFSGIITPMEQADGAGEFMTIYWDTQAWDDTDRGYFRVRWNPTAGPGGNGIWQIFGDNTETPAGSSHNAIDIPGAVYRLGNNQNKESGTYFAFSIILNTTTPIAVPWTTANKGQAATGMGSYGHFQIGGAIYDLRQLGGGYCRHTPQSGTQENTFKGGCNPGLGVSTPLANKWAGFTLERGEVTVGDALY